jgi:hypothetical protein
VGLKDVVEHALGLGRSEDVRRIAVGVARARVDREVLSTPGARVRIVRDRRDGDTARVLLWCVRRGVPVELAEGTPALFLDGAPISALDLRAALGSARTSAGRR